MAYSLQPVTHEQAVANMKSTEVPFKLLFMLSGMAGLVAVIAVSFLIADITAKPAWIALLLGGGLSVVCAAGARSVMSRVRYRITVFLSGLRLALTLGCAALVLWGLGALSVALDISWGRPLLVVIFYLVLGWAALSHLATTTRFTGGSMGLGFPGSAVTWDAVAQVVFAAGSKPGTVEIGVRPRPDATLEPRPVRDGQLLTDLPCRTVVLARKFDVDAMRWVLNQSGRRDIALVERTPAGERLLGYANSWR
ncbi:hypothetical protein [Mycobacterium talmoniae]|uniref:Uncharacterized protein n=1 Tax=Mycobacterium talmoniae TaxID=1858794 RepID=A0A1S1NHR4_9MYCO|nr:MULTISPECIES: hypothetical protein [Mycobacterium]OHV03072.1 hypothetical protein BKN37_15385 [Mycobacterium talmoniae]PQM47565.1 hypothetical protein C1Y40_02234 [Mycobacterium talmoniae]TDH54482.1 hypothetical protein E2F47_11515 [Mycobacterium eburneum]